MEELNLLGRLAKRHWEQERPNMVEGLKARRIYDKVLQQVQDEAKHEMLDLVTQQGMPWELAWEKVTKKLIFLPSEKEMVHLPESMIPYLPPGE
ncbi:hypothetical protein ACFL9U_13580 [Thermodesulfobacteriota bacterium]